MAGIWYRAGSIAVTNGSKKVVGTGTTWKTSVLKPDKGHAVHSPDGRQYELDYVESDTVMYIVTPYVGPTATGQAYAIDITRTGSIPALSREISAFSAHAQGQYDSWQKVLTGTGMVTLTAPDGQQVQVPSLSSMQSTSASLKALQALTPAADRLVYFTSPTAASLAIFTAFARSICDDANAAAVLSTLDVSDLYKKRNILGAVSQSGGVPTGGVIERGSNVNGEYTKFADGSMVCTIATGALDTGVVGGHTIPLPAMFASSPKFSVCATGVPGISAVASGVGSSTINGVTCFYSDTKVRVANGVNILLIGKWF